MAKESLSTNHNKTISEIEGNPVRNALLRDLPSQEYECVYPKLAFVQLRLHDVLQETGEPIQYGYFMNSGLASVLCMMKDDKSVEVGLCGRESCTGTPIAVGLKSSATEVVVQIEGTAFRINGAALVRVLCECPVLERRMQQYGQVLAMQGCQVAACNRLHEVEERLARWLLMSQDRIESALVPLTHDLLSHMLGTRRSSVTVAAGLLQKAGLITYNRGEVKIEDRERLEDAACECYDLIRKHTENWRRESV